MKITYQKFFLIFCVLITYAIALPSAAITTDWKQTKEVDLRLIAGSYNKEIKAGLQFSMKNKWHTYWRTPGDSGIPTQINWKGSNNVKDIKIQWPSPERKLDFGTIQTYIYGGEAVLPLKIETEDNTQTANINLAVKYTVCDEICIFLEDKFSLKIEPKHIDEASESLINDSLKQFPKANGTYGLNILSAKINDSGMLEASTTSKNGFNQPDLFIEAGDNFRFPAAKITYSEDKKSAIFNIPFEELLATDSLSGKNIRLTLKDGINSVEENIKLSAAAISPTKIQKTSNTSETNVNIIYILIAAFIGGLILNIMPCVLPVLSIKIMGFIKRGGQEKSLIRKSFLMSAAGIITSFLLLAGIVIAIREGGTAVDWGFQFQEPLFVFFVLTIINLFTANQFGLFEINLPYWLGGKMNDSIDSKGASSPAGNFLTGAFATLMATPCSAPFLGTAISFALSRGNAEIIYIFLVMGIGLATPYLLFALAPKLVSLMPKPGNWMLVVKKIMGLLLLATAIWLLLILMGQVSKENLYILATLSILPIIGFWLLQKTHWIIRIAILGIALLIPTILVQESKPKEWEEFSPEVIQSHIDAGDIVFVDVTAEWCLTCKWNKLNVVSTDEIQQLFSEYNVVLIKADYTVPSKPIQEYLNSYDRYGIPFNIVYGPAAKEGIKLSELLSNDEVIEAIKKAAGE